MNQVTPQGVPYSSLDYIVNNDGLYLFCKTWEPKEKPRALVFLAHGAAEHCLRYDLFGNYLAEKGFFVFSHDHVGHGQSQGDRVHIDDLNTYVDDVVQHIKDVKEKYPELPVFIFGHSMGGLITAVLCLKNETLVNGAILSGAALSVSAELFNWFTLTIFKTVAYIMPQCPVVSLGPDLICRDPQIVEVYKNDPFVHHGSLKARFILSISDAQTFVNENLEKFTTPVLAIHGEKDALVTPIGVQILVEKAKATDKTLKIYEGCFHELHNEPDGVKENVMELTANWIVNRL